MEMKEERSQHLLITGLQTCQCENGGKKEKNTISALTLGNEQSIHQIRISAHAMNRYVRLTA